MAIDTSWANVSLLCPFSVDAQDVKGKVVTPLNGAALSSSVGTPFGAIEPFIPSTALNGLNDKSKQVIIPFVERMTAAGNPPVVKIYPGVGHFIHTDVPLEFARDTVSFMKTRHVDAMTPDVIDSLINGAKPMAAAAPAAGGDKPAGLAK